PHTTLYTSRIAASDIFCFNHCFPDLQELHSFPTRRSSDLSNLSIVLAHMITFLDPVENSIGGTHNGPNLHPLPERAHHPERVEGIFFQSLLVPIQIRHDGILKF